jgi:hypothetical protein
MFRGILDNVLSGIKACFKFIGNYEHPFERKKMDTQKSSSKLSATLLALIMGASVFMAGQVWAAKYVTDPVTGKVFTAPEYGGTITFAKSSDYATDNVDLCQNSGAMNMIALVTEKLATLNWALDRDAYPFSGGFMTPVYALSGALAESWETPDATTYITRIPPAIATPVV